MAPRVPQKKLIVRKNPKEREVLHAVFASGHVPEWRDYDKMKGFLSVSGRILSRLQTGISAKQQRQLAQAIKQARHLGLLPFVSAS